MLNVENIPKNVEMLKNVGTKINFFDTNNFIFRFGVQKNLLLTRIFTNIYSHLYLSVNSRLTTGKAQCSQSQAAAVQLTFTPVWLSRRSACDRRGSPQTCAQCRHAPRSPAPSA